MRHAQTVPGLGDPPGFKLGVCDTQRNLSVDGRAAAARFGERLRQAGVRFTGVYTSQWCRCRDTATLIAGQAEDWPALNSFFDDRDAEPKQSAEVRQRIATLKPGETLLLVTHQVNITAITGIVPAMGEAVVVRAGKGGAVEVVGRLAGG
ncbi:MAG: histidine phosphatase family protein [Burkholderiales bacterium]|nr:histidine phosphatase family protein [Burkholderiales bacterium]